MVRWLPHGVGFVSIRPEATVTSNRAQSAYFPLRTLDMDSRSLMVALHLLDDLVGFEVWGVW